MLNKIVEGLEDILHETTPILEMATVGVFSTHKGNKPKGNERKVFTTSDNMPIVHVHIWDTNTGGDELSVCVRLDKPEYFIHSSAKDRFSSDDLENFIKFLQAPYKGKIEYSGHKIKTNWDFTIVQWNNENPDYAMDISLGDDGYIITPPMPDYTLLSTN